MDWENRADVLDAVLLLACAVIIAIVILILIANMAHGSTQSIQEQVKNIYAGFGR